MKRKDYVACANFEDTIYHYALSNDPLEAFNEFIKKNGEFTDFCEDNDVDDNTEVNVKVFSIIYANDPRADQELFEDGWEWMIDEEVLSKNVLYKK